MKKNLKKLLAVTTGIALISATMVGCDQASRVSHNISEQADNFNVIRQITVINCIQGDVLFQMTGKMSLYADTTDNQLEVTVEDENGSYKKHFIGLYDSYRVFLNQYQAKM